MGYEKQVRCIVIFGDIRGFSVWEQSVTRPDTEFLPLLNTFETLLKDFEKKTGNFTKNMGDGYMQIIELKDLNHKDSENIAIKALLSTMDFCTKINKMIKAKPWPRPDGFRVRFTSGHIWKKNGKVTDYVGRYVNMAHKLLRIHAEKTPVCHQSFLELIGEERISSEKLEVARLKADRRIPDGLTRLDATALWEISKK